ncbi:hypothetical protein Patl1_02267 [Pistacia atlantica]|uniref:Uncharacterized protein n=1 Tax=Pistacia atlantica TaxID=434234 RepID=A0ACC1C4H5_9ROSI|nr:hypothetical protein Patl1_02267 [Pistacia atlantica]
MYYYRHHLFHFIRKPRLLTVFNGLNFSEWCEKVKFHLDVLDLDLVLLEDKPPAITDSSNEEKMLYHKAFKWSNRLSLMFLRMTIANNIKTTIPQTKRTKEYLAFVEERLRSVDKSLGGILMAQLTTIKFDRSRIANHRDDYTVAPMLKTLRMMDDDSFWCSLF